jgi:purine-binding chemotaxis protein CheW
MQTEPLTHAAEAAMAAAPAQFLTFTVGEGEYGVDIMSVREIKGWSEVTRLPNRPDHMRGVMNLRGLIIPIFDLRCRFGQGLTEAGDKHAIVILAVGDRTIGVLVDAVSDILEVTTGEIKPAPQQEEAAAEGRYVSGLIAREGRMVVLLRMEDLFHAHEGDVAVDAAD